MSRPDALDTMRWERLPYPERPFVRRRADVAEPLTLARVRAPGPGAAAVSIVIPTADARREGRLGRLLEQIERQTWRDREVLLVRGDRRQGRAINAAAALAEGRLLLTLDDDTALAHPRAIERAVEALEADPRIGMAGGINVVPPDAPWLVARVMREVPRRSTPPVSAITDSDLAEHPFLMMRREAFVRVGGENELIPRGLDPYLREEFRRAGYRVVVVPGAEYSHLPPSTLGALVRQFYRNGAAAAFVSRRFPEWAIETPSTHALERARVPLPLRVLRFPLRLAGALVTGRPIWFLCEVAYALGFARGWCAPARRDGGAA